MSFDLECPITIDFLKLQNGSIIYFKNPISKQNEFVTFKEYDIESGDVLAIYTEELDEPKLDYQFEPVPLTSKILRKYSFTNLNEYKLLDDSIKRIFYVFNESDHIDGKGLYIAGEKYKNPIENLHELQEALSELTAQKFSFYNDSTSHTI